VVVEVSSIKPQPTFTYRRDEKSYNSQTLCERLAEVDWSCDFDNVQSCWNSFENKALGPMLSTFMDVFKDFFSTQRFYISVDFPVNILSRDN
jgi:hypothetical protein